MNVFVLCYGDHQDLHSFPTRRSSDLHGADARKGIHPHRDATSAFTLARERGYDEIAAIIDEEEQDRKSTRLNSSHMSISYAVFCLKKKKLIYQAAVLAHRAAL